MNDNWMGTTEASERLGVTSRSLRSFIDGGLLTAFRFGRVIRLRESDLEKFLERSRLGPGLADTE
jgi:excisionase family DNA binding protein